MLFASTASGVFFGLGTLLAIASVVLLSHLRLRSQSSKQHEAGSLLLPGDAGKGQQQKDPALVSSGRFCGDCCGI